MAVLPRDLAIFAFTYLQATLGLPAPAHSSGKPSAHELDSVLVRHLQPDKRGHHIRTFGVLELESERCLGVQRIRCFPFNFDQFRGTNPLQYVGFVPPLKWTGIALRDFDLARPEHRAKMWVGRVELLFSCTFHEHPGGEAGEYDLAFISCLWDLRCPSALGPLQRKAGARLFYVPTKAWSIVVPVNHILGRVPLMQCHLAGSSAATIPHSMSADKRVYFKHGCADGPGRAGVGTGSRVFELNVHLWQFGRPQARTITVRERQERIARVKAAANAKREATRLSKKRARLQEVPDAAAAAGGDGRDAAAAGRAAAACG